MIRKLPSGEYRLYSRKKDAKTGKRRNLGTFKTRAASSGTSAPFSTSNDAGKRGGSALLTLILVTSGQSHLSWQLEGMVRSRLIRHSGGSGNPGFSGFRSR
jgi:hypothetical protein